MAGKLEFRFDNTGKFCAELCDEVSAAMKLFSETDAQRIRHGVHAYAILDIRTSLGLFRGRNVRIRWSYRNEKFYVQWHQWNTGRPRRHDGKPERMDVFGPADSQSRDNINNLLLEMFSQIKEESAAGTLGRANPELKELRASLEAEKVEAETASAAADVEAGQDELGETIADDLADATEAQIES